jgi:ABC-type polysaccharide/polyol phosphate transport system ATPase subunit
LIKVNNVAVKFLIPNDHVNSLKEYFIKKFTGKLRYKEFTALQDISFSVGKGEVIGIIGSNGAGKSTLLKVISGILSPTSGSVQVNGSVAPLLELGAGFDVDLTARENIFLNGAVLGYSKQYLLDKYDEIVEFSEIKDFMDTPIRNFSSGMIMRLAFSIATLVNPDILIVDEILSVGDAHFQKKSLSRMKDLMSGGTTVLLVSHSLEQIRKMCSRAIWIEQGRIMRIGETDDVCDAYLRFLGEVPQAHLNQNIDWRHRLYSPTHIQKIGDQYFIVDCWHHRVIYHNNLTDSIENWSTLCDDLHRPQSIVSDGNVLLVEDTNNDQIRCFQRIGNRFLQLIAVPGVGKQPHRIIYDESIKLFYGIAAESGQVFVLKMGNGLMSVERLVSLEYLANSYVRSLSLIDGLVYFVSGPGKIAAAKCDDLSFDLIASYDVPFELRGMNDIVKIGSYYYISVYQDGSMEIRPRLVRTMDLRELANGAYEDIYDKLGLKGVPYYFSFLDDRVFLTEIDTYSSIISFKIDNDQFYDIKTVYDIGRPNESSLERKNQY